MRAVLWSHTNPAINEDESSVDGPDLDAWQLQKGVRRLLATLPVKENGLKTAYWLLKALDPRRAGLFDEDPTPTFKRWEAIQPDEKFNKIHESECWDLDLKEEFLCLMAVLFGRYSADKKVMYLGSAESSDRPLRCAYYSRAKMNAEQMQQAYNKDTDAFTLAALYNDKLYWQQETRAKLEELIRGRLIHVYRRRC